MKLMIVVINDLVAFVVKLWVFGEVKQVNSHVQGMKSFVFSDLLAKTFKRFREHFQKNSLDVFSIKNTALEVF